MPLWAIIALSVIGSLVVVAGIAVGAVYVWRAYVKSVLFKLVVRAEAIEAAGQALVETVTRLAQADDTTLQEFAEDPESSERRALHEVSTRAHMTAYELDRLAMPRSVVPVAESLADAAIVIEQEASRVQDPHLGESALEALAGVDLATIGIYMTSARERLNEACLTHGLEEMAVYGGGLYL